MSVKGSVKVRVAQGLYSYRRTAAQRIDIFLYSFNASISNIIMAGDTAGISTADLRISKSLTVLLLISLPWRTDGSYYVAHVATLDAGVSTISSQSRCDRARLPRDLHAGVPRRNSSDSIDGQLTARIATSVRCMQ